MNELRSALNQLNINYEEETIEKFNQYMEEVLEWNEKVNLTAITDRVEFVKKHYIDSISCVQFDEYKDAKKIIDVGTGAGFPGVPLALLSPDKEFLLMDSLNKKIKIVDEICQKVGIANVKVLHGRAEEVAMKKEYREQFDMCVVRAVANLTVLSEYCLPFIKLGGYMLAYKGPDSDNEIQSASKAIKVLGGEIVKIEKVKLDNFLVDHRILFIKKIKETPAKFPRKAGTPTKDPIK
ncbi:MAG: 16S rRNA (guanine(527)-N(7))-methyltransferase RsmG [Anaerovoracaceae bacterium]